MEKSFEDVHDICFAINHVMPCHFNDVLNYIEQEYKANLNEICILGSSPVNEQENIATEIIFTPVEFYLQICYKFELCKTNLHFFGKDDSLLILQLCLADRNKKNTGKFEVDETYVVKIQEQLTNFRLNLRPEMDEDDHGNLLQDILHDYEMQINNMQGIDEVQLYNLIKSYIEDSEHEISVLGKVVFVLSEIPEDTIQRYMLELLIDKKRVCCLYVESDLNESVDLFGTCDESTNCQHIKVDWKSLNMVFAEASSCHSSVSSESLSQVFLERAIMAYFRLLGNTRDEIALATALNSMTKEFSHEAFTALKKLAKELGLSMYQAAISLVLRTKLGGKSYAPDRSCPLVSFLPELTIFTEVMHKIQTMVEDFDTRIAIQKIINSIKCHMVKTCDPKLHRDSIDMAVMSVEKLVSAALNQRSLAYWNATQENEKRSLVIGQWTVDKLREISNKYHVIAKLKNDLLTDNFSSQKIPVRLRSVISLFRSPECIALAAPVLQMTKQPLADINETNTCKVDEERHEGSIKSPLRNEDHHCKIDEKENLSSTPHRHTTLKRTTLAKINDEHRKRQKSTGKTNKMTKRKPALVKGQQLMTKFFRT